MAKRKKKTRQLRTTGKSSWQKERLKKIAQFHAIATVALFVLYVGLSAIYSPEFLLSDIRAKFSAVADSVITVTAKVLAPPVQPIVTGTAICSNGNLSINLNWPADENSYSFNIDRDGGPLITGLTNPAYQDNAISVNNSYSYVVTAIGPMGPGFAVSDSLVVATPSECSMVLPAPAVTITTIGSKNIGGFGENITTTDKRPPFSGTSNIPNAIIDKSILSTLEISGQTIANLNGYWTWTPPQDISIGDHTLFVTATDPLDPTRTATDQFDFSVTEKNNGGSNNNSNPSSPHKSARQNTQRPVQNPLSFSLSLTNSKIFQGQQLQPLIHIDKLAPAYAQANAAINYKVIDQQGNELFTLSGKDILSQGKSIFQDLQLPKYIKEGRYRLQAEIVFDIFSISKEVYFEVAARPLVDLGAGVIVTYPELLSKLGTLSLFLLLLLLLWIILFAREYWMYLHALRHVTERGLERLGMLGIKKRKGVTK